MDLNGVRIPARTVAGKYCPWIYIKGTMYEKQKSACYWLDHEQISDTSNNKFSFYFTKNDEPLYSGTTTFSMQTEQEKISMVNYCKS